MKKIVFSIIIITIIASRTLATEIIFHRGDVVKAHDNTIEAIKTAWENGAKIVEADFYYTDCDEIFVFHTPYDLKRYWGWKGSDTKKLTCEEVKSMKLVGGKFKDKMPNARIPTAEDVIATIPENGILLIDSKDPGDTLEKLEKFVDKIEAARKANKLGYKNIAFMTSCDKSRYIKSKFPEYKTYICRTVADKSGKLAIDAEKLAEECVKCGADGISIGHWIPKNLELIDANFLAPFKKRNLKMCVWTENDTANISKWEKLGFDTIITDKGVEFLEFQKSRK